MEFHEKLQQLRKQKGLTQEQLADILFVSRTAVSKWESGRGFPNLESLKAISRFYNVTLDDLLSGEEILALAERDHREKEADFQSLAFSLVDCCAMLLLFLPLFAHTVDGTIHEVSLFGLTAPLYLKALYTVIAGGIVTAGILTFTLQNFRECWWMRRHVAVSLALGIAGVILFILGKHPYAAVFMFVFLVVKALMLLKRQ